MFFALVLTNCFTEAIEYGERVIETVNNITHTKEFNYYAKNFHYEVINSLLIYSKYKLTGSINESDIDMLISFTPANAYRYSSHQYIIIINFISSELLYALGDTKRSEEYFNMAVNLCEYTQYKLFMAYILLNNPRKNTTLRNKGLKMFEDNNFSVKTS